MRGAPRALRPPAALVVICGSLLAIWQIVASSMDVPDFMLPTPLEVTRAFAQYSDLLISDTIATASVAMLGLAWAIAVSFISALIFAHFHAVRNAGLSLLAALEATPKIAIAPLLVLWFGLGSTPKIIVAASIAYFPLVVNLTRGLSEVDQDLLDMACVWGARPLATLRYLKIPNAAVPFFDGLRVALPGALVGAIIAEFISSDRGLGYRVLIANASLQTELVFASLLCIAAVALSGMALLSFLEHRLLVWRTWMATQ